MRLALPSLLLPLVLLGACASPLPTVASGPAPNPMAVDGDAREWEGALRPVPEETGLSMGVRNDADALYLVVVAGDGWQARRIAASGLTVWLNGDASSRKAYGLAFPVGLGSDGERGRVRPGVLDGERPRPDERSAQRPDPDLQDRLREQFILSLDRIEVTRDGDEQSIAVGGAAGIETAAAWTPDGLTVELRVPLRSGPYAVGVSPGAALGLGIELGDVARTGGARRGVQGRRPIGGRGVGRQPEGAPQPREREAPGSVVRWMAVELAR